MPRLFAAFCLFALLATQALADTPRLLDAHGGGERLKALTGVRFTLKLIDYQSGEASLSEQWLDFERGRVFRRDSSKSGVVIRSSDGKRGWRKDVTGVHALTADEAKAALGSLNYNFLYLLPRARIARLGDGKHYSISAPFIEQFSVGVDAAGRITQLMFPNNVSGTESDYRDVNGIPWPFRYDTFRNGLKQKTGEFLEFELNPDWSRINFSEPQNAAL